LNKYFGGSVSIEPPENVGNKISDGLHAVSAASRFCRTAVARRAMFPVLRSTQLTRVHVVDLQIMPPITQPDVVSVSPDSDILPE